MKKVELEVKRTPEELEDFVKSTFELINADPKERGFARLKRTPYKELVEEVYPLSIFCKLKYLGHPVLCQPVIGNQGHDAKIESITGDLIETIEVSWPIDGQKAYFNALQLNRKGYSEMEIRDVNDDTPRKQIIDRIVCKAKDKALKDYSTEQGSSLVFVLNIAPYFGMHQLEHPDDIECLALQLKNISFKVKNTYLLLLPINELIEIR